MVDRDSPWGQYQTPTLLFAKPTFQHLLGRDVFDRLENSRITRIYAVGNVSASDCRHRRSRLQLPLSSDPGPQEEIHGHFQRPDWRLQAGDRQAQIDGWRDG